MSKKEEILHKLDAKDRNYLKEKFREKDKQIASLQKEFELACGTLRYCKSQDEIKRLCEEYIYCSKFVNFNQIEKTIDYFKTKAKETIEKDDD